ncbi:uncharacterized protein LOC135376763, partial [Ornithodoros turicata]|uniref:uncharacterized protein LOC135376763 n=1 Tax=Ornithodoros turicata TaxID=34597 RepID=UPI003139AF72
MASTILRRSTSRVHDLSFCGCSTIHCATSFCRNIRLNIKCWSWGFFNTELEPRTFLEILLELCHQMTAMSGSTAALETQSAQVSAASDLGTASAQASEAVIGP